MFSAIRPTGLNRTPQAKQQNKNRLRSTGRCRRPFVTRVKLVASIARGRCWLDKIVANSGTSAEKISNREKCSMRKVNLTVSLAFLAPNLVMAAIEGRLPSGIGITRLCDLPAEWSRQYQTLGLPTL